MPIDTIIFDFGGVLVDWDPRYLFNKLLPDAQTVEWFLSTVCTEEWNLQQDKGRSFAEAVAMLQREYPEHGQLIALYYERWDEMLQGAIPGSVEMLQELKQENYQLYGLTNWSAGSFPVVLKKFDFFRLFDGIVVSGEEKLVKPDASLFQLLLDRYQLTADTCVFIDDKLVNVEAARQLGMRGILFQSAPLLRQHLTEMGLLPRNNSE